MLTCARLLHGGGGGIQYRVFLSFHGIPWKEWIIAVSDAAFAFVNESHGHPFRGQKSL